MEFIYKSVPWCASISTAGFQESLELVLFSICLLHKHFASFDFFRNVIRHFAWPALHLCLHILQSLIIFPVIYVWL